MIFRIFLISFLIIVLSPALYANDKIKYNETGIIDTYRVEVASKVQKNWQFYKNRVSEKIDPCEIVIQVTPNGGIRSIVFDKYSSNRDLNNSALEAVFKSFPVKPFSKRFNRPFVKVGLHFSP